MQTSLASPGRSHRRGEPGLGALHALPRLSALHEHRSHLRSSRWSSPRASRTRRGPAPLADRDVLVRGELPATGAAPRGHGIGLRTGGRGATEGLAVRDALSTRRLRRCARARSVATLGALRSPLPEPRLLLRLTPHRQRRPAPPGFGVRSAPLRAVLSVLRPARAERSSSDLARPCAVPRSAAYAGPVSSPRVTRWRRLSNFRACQVVRCR